jgi:hypothetical protein
MGVMNSAGRRGGDEPLGGLALRIEFPVFAGVLVGRVANGFGEEGIIHLSEGLVGEAAGFIGELVVSGFFMSQITPYSGMADGAEGRSGMRSQSHFDHWVTIPENIANSNSPNGLPAFIGPVPAQSHSF